MLEFIRKTKWLFWVPFFVLSKKGVKWIESSKTPKEIVYRYYFTVFYTVFWFLIIFKIILLCLQK